MSQASDTLSQPQFERLRQLIHRECGIHLTSEKRTMLELRLKKRMRGIGLTTCTEYCNHLFHSTDFAGELVHLIDVVTTNKTDFFREAGHFDYLTARGLPQLAAKHGNDGPLVIWSAGCSTGEEPYTLAMVLSEYAQNHAGFRFRLLATDISTKVLEKARLGIFKADVAAPVPLPLRRKYLMHNRDKCDPLVRIVPELRAMVEFRRLNFMEEDYGITGLVHAIFCRNVIIYFDRPTQARMLAQLSSYLPPGGLLFLGHSETLHGMDLPLDPIAPSIYRKTHDR